MLYFINFPEANDEYAVQNTFDALKTCRLSSIFLTVCQGKEIKENLGNCIDISTISTICNLRMHEAADC